MHKLPGKIFRVNKAFKGTTVNVEENRCPICSHPIDPSWKFCKNCGFKLHTD